MKVKYLIILLIVAGVTISSCNRDELFEREQYKKVFALLSDDNIFNIFAEEHDLELSESPGFVSAVCGGSLPTEEDINITIVEDDDLLLQFNRSNFDVDESRYARRLPRERYDISNYNITVPAGERTGLMPLTVRLNGLSPDSVYIVPMRVDKFTAYELNPEKGDVLYRVFLKNYYATNKTTSTSTAVTATSYNYRLKRNGVNAMGSKYVFPVGGNSVRISAGDITFEAKADLIRDISVLLTVDEEKNVTIQPWANLNITQVDGDPEYPNTFLIFDDGYKQYKTFLLRYDYVYNGTTYQIQEELKFEILEKNDY
jgi:hypothetical protein